MRMRFDRGTLLFDDVPAGLDLGVVQGVRFDPRVNAWRARACDRELILLELIRRHLDVVDDTMRALGPPAPFPAPELREYQEDALLAWESARRRGVVVLPTGAGKTRVAIAAIARTGCRALILVPTRVLVEQWRVALADAGISRVGQYAEHRHELGAVTVATIEAAWRSMHLLGDAFELVVVDEVHRIGGEVKSEALEMSVAPFRLGLTATLPDADSLTRVTRLVGPVVHRKTSDDLAGTFLSPFDLVVVPVELTKGEREIYDRHKARYHAWADEQLFVEPDLDFATLLRRAKKTPEGRAALDSLRRARTVLSLPTQKRAALKALLDEHRARKVLVFTGDNKTAYAIAREHLIWPVTCEVSRVERQRVLALFRAGAIRALVSSQVLNEGVDVPDADVAIVVAGRAGEREHVQRIGRVLRPSEGKRALVVELVVPRTSEAQAGRRRRRSLAQGRAVDGGVP
jgi:superfamily II DNA or RNA helicase